MARRKGCGLKPKANAEPDPETVQQRRERRLAQRRVNDKNRRARVRALPPEERPKPKPKPKPEPAAVYSGEAFGPALPAEKIGGFTPKPEILPGLRRAGEVAHGECCWPVGDPAHPSFRFCGRAKVTSHDIPYCADHARVAYNPDAWKPGTKPLRARYMAKRR